MWQRNSLQFSLFAQVWKKRLVSKLNSNPTGTFLFSSYLFGSWLLQTHQGRCKCSRSWSLHKYHDFDKGLFHKGRFLRTEARKKWVVRVLLIIQGMGAKRAYVTKWRFGLRLQISLNLLHFRLQIGYPVLFVFWSKGWILEKTQQTETNENLVWCWFLCFVLQQRMK